MFSFPSISLLSEQESDRFLNLCCQSSHREACQSIRFRSLCQSPLVVLYRSTRLSSLYPQAIKLFKVPGMKCSTLLGDFLELIVKPFGSSQVIASDIRRCRHQSIVANGLIPFQASVLLATIQREAFSHMRKKTASAKPSERHRKSCHL